MNKRTVAPTWKPRFFVLLELSQKRHSLRRRLGFRAEGVAIFRFTIFFFTIFFFTNFFLAGEFFTSVFFLPKVLFLRKCKISVVYLSHSPTTKNSHTTFDFFFIKITEIWTTIVSRDRIIHISPLVEANIG